MIAASFYTPRPNHPRHRYDFIECLLQQRASCAKYGVQQVVITDQDLGHDLLCFQTPMPEDLMPAIIKGQMDFLRWATGSHAANAMDIMLIGADGLLGKDPRPLFDGSFDLAVTTHPFADCILNTGLICIPAGRAGQVATVWEQALAQCGVEWGDDQLALAAVIRPTLNHGLEDRPWGRTKFLPVPGHNDAPDSLDHRIDAYVCHFRGPRKQWMKSWAAKFAA